jgi:cell division cycle 2-like protein
MDFIEHDMKALLHEMPIPFVASEIKALMWQLLSAVDHLHANWILHRDLKTSNLLMNNMGELKVADFGLARRFSYMSGRDGGDATENKVKRPLTQMVVTLWYRAPELLLGCTQYATAVDMWSVGCIFAEFILREPLFPGQGEIDQLDRVFKMMGRLETHWPPGLSLPYSKNLNWSRFPETCQLRTKLSAPLLTEAGYDLLLRLLDLNPERRISAQQALRHAYFKEHPPPKDSSMFPTFPSRANGELYVKHYFTLCSFYVFPITFSAACTGLTS